MEFDRCFLFSRLKSCTMWRTLPFTGSCKRYWNPLQHHTKPHISQCCSLTRSACPEGFPCKSSQAGAPYPSPYCTASGTEPAQPTGEPTMQPPTAPSLRSSPNSVCAMYKPRMLARQQQSQCTGRTRGSHQPRQPSTSPDPFHQGHSLSVKSYCRKRGRKATPYQDSYAFHTYLFRIHSCQYAPRITHATLGLP